MSILEIEVNISGITAQAKKSTKYELLKMVWSQGMTTRRWCGKQDIPYHLELSGY